MSVMKVAFCADVHAGNHRRHGGPVVAGMNTRCRLVIESFRTAHERAAAAGAGTFVVVGDLLDYVRPEPQLIAALADIIGGNRAMTTILVRGNHEAVSDVRGDHALGPFRHVARVVETPEVVAAGVGTEDVEILCVPNKTGGDPSEPPVTFHPPSPRVVRLAAIHRGISDSRTPAFLRGLAYTECARWAGMSGCDAVFAGDWHDRQSWTFDAETAPRGMAGFPAVHQLGALVPTGWDNPGIAGFGCVLVHDTKTREHQTIHVPGPRFVKVRSRAEADDAVRDAAREGCTLFVQMVAMPDEVPALTAIVAEGIRVGTLRGGEVITETATVRAAARAAADATRSASTLTEAVAGYVEALEIREPGVTKADVLARARMFLGLPAQGG